MGINIKSEEYRCLQKERYGISDHKYEARKKLRMKSKLVLINLITESYIEIILNQVCCSSYMGL